MGAVRAGAYWRAHPELSFVAIYATVLLGALVVLRTVAARTSRDQLRAGAWLVFLLLGALLASVAPGAIIYFLAPPTAVLIGVIVSRWWRPAEAIGGLVAIVILFLTWGEMLGLLEVLFNPGPLWIAGPVAAIMIPALAEAQGCSATPSARPCSPDRPQSRLPHGSWSASPLPIHNSANSGSRSSM